MGQENETSSNDRVTQQPRTCLVILEYQAVYSDPISLNAGETFKLSEKSITGTAILPGSGYGVRISEEKVGGFQEIVLTSTLAKQLGSLVTTMRQQN